ncbi:MAG: ABC transporter ATP-binding protein [Oscillospiraceae bacterium]|jgi:oligopeptide/dipeptide ABC transporter ATP-binding protein|nr:ABC transporter ATP-binding protein [Oscillospiraceae bacterium]
MGVLLEVNDLVTQFRVDKRVMINAANHVSFTLDEGETLAIVGESGSGKSVTALSVMGLVPSPPGHIEQGEILFRGVNLLKLGPRKMREIRGNSIGMIFQEPMTSLNPVFTVGAQITEAIRVHNNVSMNEARDRAIELLKQVEIPDPQRRMKTYPHQMSGGMRQRVMICMALASNPSLLIADEPTTALDVTIQAQILALIRGIARDHGTAVLFITHDLGVVADIAQRAIVMYAGSVVEMGHVRDLFSNPLHPYTRGLLQAIPKLATPRGKPLYTIPGIVPDLSRLPEGCAFVTRCPMRQTRCRKEKPQLRTMPGGRQARCFLAEGGAV